MARNSASSGWAGDWAQVEAEAKGQEVFFHAWGGDPKINTFIAWVGDEAFARSEGFRLIAGYIFGGNAASAQIAMTAPVAQATGGEQIAMTAPVAQQSSAAGWRIQFFMPAKYDLATLPKPKDARVKLVQLPPQTFAVLAFSGSRSPAAVTLKQKQLADKLNQASWTSAGEPQAWFYDPPWTLPFMRLNEVAGAVARR